MDSVELRSKMAKMLISMDLFFPEHLKTRGPFGCGIWRSHNAGPTFPWGWIGSTNPRETVRWLKPNIDGL